MLQTPELISSTKVPLILSPDRILVSVEWWRMKQLGIFTTATRPWWASGPLKGKLMYFCQVHYEFTCISLYSCCQQIPPFSRQISVIWKAIFFKLSKIVLRVLKMFLLKINSVLNFLQLNSKYQNHGLNALPINSHSLSVPSRIGGHFTDNHNLQNNDIDPCCFKMCKIYYFNNITIFFKIVIVFF